MADWLISGGLILVYHRVTAVDTDPWGLCVAPENFAEHLQVLRRQGECLTVGEMVRRLADGRLPRRAVAISFDDGYADNLLAAKPLLERHAVPATFFLCPGLLDGRHEFWWDDLERILIRPGTVPDSLSLEIERRVFQRRWNGVQTLTVEDWWQHRSWRSCESPPTERHKLYLDLWALMKPLRHEVRRPLLKQLAEWADVDDLPRASYRPMSIEEALTLGSGNLFEIGAHTMTHATLPAQSPEIQQAEIRDSKAACERLWGRDVTSFSYPYGDFTERELDAVRNEGFTAACSTIPGRIRGTVGVGRFRLPRQYIGNWDGAKFERQLLLSR